MRIVVGADHAGLPLKGAVVQALRDWGHAVEDVGTDSPEPVDFPDVARVVCEPVRHGGAERGVLVCGTGIGACIAANKFAGIRAAVCHDVHSAHQAVEHDDANVCCLGARIVGDWLALDLLRAFVDARFSGEDHFRRRLDKLARLEREQVTQSISDGGR